MKSTNKKFKIIFLFSILVISPLFLTVHASDSSTLEVGNDINIQTIRIPLFISFNLEFTKSATVFSWISFLGVILTFALVIFWIYLILRASVKAMQSRGESEGLEDVSKRFKSIFTGMFITFLFPIILSVVGVLIGIGTIFSWPKMFSVCDGTGSTKYQYYFQSYLDNPEDFDNPANYADGVCRPLKLSAPGQS